MKTINIIIFLAGAYLNIYSPMVEPHEGNKNLLPTHEYHLTIKNSMVTIADQEVMGMTINDSIPGPTLRFIDGEYAVIYVTNNMEMETSLHWHGILLPNFFDGVPYLTTPPIMPGETQKYEFELKQTGTYWYHSHTMLQEQSGLYGAIVIEPKENKLNYDSDLVLLISDWTNEKPMNVLRNLKRGNEWYGIKKGTSTPLNRVVGQGALGAQFNFWRQRMEGADIADVYYPAFLTNGRQNLDLQEFEAGDKIRLRIINGSSSSQYWLTFGGEDPLLVSADGLDVDPVKHPKTFIAIAETYDFIVTIPANKKIEIRATAQDGSGHTSTFLGQGELLSAPEVPKPNQIAMMQQMAKMKMKMGAPALKFQPHKDERHKMKEKYSMSMHHDDMSMNSIPKKNPTTKKTNQEELMDTSKPKKSMMHMDHDQDTGVGHTKEPNEKIDSSKEGMMKTSGHQMHQNQDTSKNKMPTDDMHMDMAKDANMDNMNMPPMDMNSEFNYDYLQSPAKTTYPANAPVQEILLNLTGNMNRYVWSMNGVPLSETDKIKIKADQVTRIKLNNLTMMHHPMHLHGHFFRVINQNGEYSPLKHTVNVAPMQEVTIEFYGSEYGDWFFHCHVLYHMMSGMARVFSYDTPRDQRLNSFPLKNLIDEADQFYSWGRLDAASHMTEINLVSSNIRNQINFSTEYGWNKNLEAELSYERYIQDYFRIFGGINIENKNEDDLSKISTTAVAGFRFLTPYLFNLDIRLDNKLRPQLGLSREILIFPRTLVFGRYEYQADFGWVNDFEDLHNYRKEVVWSAGFEYFLSRNFSLMASYDNRFGAGGGLSIRF
ncbi:MAG: multicopper oxidase domain-containing protein [Saprospiraceae bacterium]|nr:multicopper oxidase domain-containing protein [Saprospiraceae bacterium]